MEKIEQGITLTKREMIDTPAAHSAARFLWEFYGTRACDREAVSECVRCNAIFIARWVIETAKPETDQLLAQLNHCQDVIQALRSENADLLERDRQWQAKYIQAMETWAEQNASKSNV